MKPIAMPPPKDVYLRGCDSSKSVWEGFMATSTQSGQDKPKNRHYKAAEDICPGIGKLVVVGGVVPHIVQIRPTHAL